MGGFVAAELAIAHPQRVERLVLVSAAGISTHQPRGSTRAMPALRRMERILIASGAWAASRSDTVARRARLREATLSVVVRHPSRLPAALAAEQLRGAGKPGFMQGLEAVIDYEIRERLREIDCPTLIVWGERDRLISVRDADVFAELIQTRARSSSPTPAHGDARAPGRVQPPARRVSRRTGILIVGVRCAADR